jgi:Domain of unknown function (DUF2017)
VKVTGRRGRLRLHLDRFEVDLLGVLFDELDAVLDGEAGDDDEVLRRLNPDAYQDDPQAEADYRGLTESSLRSERTDRMAGCRADLSSESGDVDLSDPDTARRWLQVLNDLRLALGTRLGITEDDDHEIDPSASDGPAREVYYWLTAVQDSVVQALM